MKCIKDNSENLNEMPDIIKSDNYQKNIFNLVPTTENYQKIIDKYHKGIMNNDFYEEPIGEDNFYPDW
tara:strand:- start:1579 stop:1782 length:204 start_codon:yes stop_codon:yes gene_type:complete